MENVLLCWYLVSGNVLRSSLMSEFTHGYNGIAKHHAVGAVDALGCCSVCDADSITDNGEIPENSCGGSKMTSCGEAENIYLLRIGIVLLGALSDGLDSQSRLNERGVILCVFTNGIMEQIAVHTFAEEISDDRLSLAGSKHTVAAAGADDDCRTGSADGSLIANVSCKSCLGVFFPKIEFLIKHNTKCPFPNKIVHRGNYSTVFEASQ